MKRVFSISIFVSVFVLGTIPCSQLSAGKKIDLTKQFQECDTELLSKDLYSYYSRFDNLEEKSVIKFSTLSQYELRTGIGNPCDHIALQCKWQQVFKEISANMEDRLKKNPKSKSKKIPKDIKANLVGFLEGRLKCKLPVWFEQMILNASLDPEIYTQWKAEEEFERESYTPVSFEFDEKYINFRKKVDYSKPDFVLAWRSFNIASVKLNGTGKKKKLNIKLKDGNRLNFTPSDSIKDIAEKYISVTEIKKSYLICIGDSGSPDRKYPVICIDKKSGKVRWEQESWVICTPVVGYSGIQPVTAMQWVTSRDYVLLFGGAGDSCYIERYNLHTGKVNLRFSPSYSMELIKKKT